MLRKILNLTDFEAQLKDKPEKFLFTVENKIKNIRQRVSEEIYWYSCIGIIFQPNKNFLIQDSFIER